MPRLKTKNSSKLKVKDQSQQRMDAVEELLQTGRDQLFVGTAKNHVFRFALYSRVLVLSQGLWYEAMVSSYYRRTSKVFRPDIVPCGTAVNIPTYLVHFVGWPKSTREEVPETEIVATNTSILVDLVAMLLAHEWNMHRKGILGCTSEKLGNGVWILPDETYQMLEKEWQKRAIETMTFGQFVGREPGAYKTAQV